MASATEFRRSPAPRKTPTTRDDSTPTLVMSMTRDLRGDIWIGCEDQGVFHYRCSTGQYTRFTSEDGLGDNSAYAMACDRLGRIWVGHLNHGVSVFNGESWKNYDILTGPLGERVFDIAVCPTDGDVWMASSCGLARYSEKNDTWSYFTRADGLPSDQASAIAFDRDGNIYLGTQCDGVALAAAADGYKTWRQLTGPDRPPTEPTGQGLPTNLVNDVLVARDGTIYVATTCGLTWSKDRGATWTYLRGRDWADKVRNRYGGPPQGWSPRNADTLLQDYVTCLAENANGSLYIGHRAEGWATFDPATGKCSKGSAGADGRSFVTCVLPREQGTPFIGTYGSGTQFLGRTSAGGAIVVSSSPSSKTVRHPSDAQPPAVIALAETIAKATAAERDQPTALFLRDDWLTQGDWVGRYGRPYALLCGAESPLDTYINYARVDYRISGEIGPHCTPGDGLRHWLQDLRSDDPRVLWNPTIGSRRLAAWDDHGEAYPPSYEGPDLLIRVRVPEGIHRASLYFVSGNAGTDRFRDYVIELHHADAAIYSQLGSPPQARTRVRGFRGGVYKQFLLSGPNEWVLHVARNGSYNTVCAGAFLDHRSGPRNKVDEKPLPWLFLPYGAPDAPREAHLPQSAAALPGLWRDTSKNPSESDCALRLLLYRSALAAQAPDALLAAWRWHLPLWNDQDRVTFALTMKAAWEKAAAENPHWAAALEMSATKEKQ